VLIHLILGMKILVPILALLAIACNQTPKPAAAPVSEKKTTDEPYFPVNDFFMNQVAYIDSMKLPVVETIESGKQKSMRSLNTKELIIEAADFLSIDLNDPQLKPQYKENSFADQTLGTATFTYSAKSDSLPLRRLDVIVSPDPVANDKVKSCYAEKFQKSGDTTVVKKLFWQANKRFQIITSKQAGSDTAHTTITTVNWN
jgi:hypothetical protein